MLPLSSDPILHFAFVTQGWFYEWIYILTLFLPFLTKLLFILSKGCPRGSHLTCILYCKIKWFSYSARILLLYCACCIVCFFVSKGSDCLELFLSSLQLVYFLDAFNRLPILHRRAKYKMSLLIIMFILSQLLKSMLECVIGVSHSNAIYKPTESAEYAFFRIFDGQSLSATI